MYAVIIQSAPSAGTIVRQTVVVPATPQPRVFSRIAAGRGSNGAWGEFTLTNIPAVENEPLVGTPFSVRLTDKDHEALAEPGIPQVLCQKLSRPVRGVTRVSSPETAFTDVFEEALRIAESSPSEFAKYLSVPATESVAAPVAIQQAPSVSVVVPEEITAAFVIANCPSVEVPTDASVASHIERTIDGFTQTEVFDYARANQKTVSLMGHSGVGKTSGARHYANKRGLPFVQFECTPQTDEEQVQGTYVVTGNPDAPLRWQYSDLVAVAMQGGVLLLNEFNRMPAKSNSFFLALLEERIIKVSRHRGEVLHVHPDCLIIADANPGYRGAMFSDQAFLDRIALPIEYKYDREIEKHIVPSEALLDIATGLRVESELDDKWGVPISTRLLLNFVEQAQALSLSFAIERFVCSFPTEEERSALRHVFEANRELLASELGVAA